jgi:hypothetical protein
MKIGTEKEYIELLEIERTPSGIPCAGDVRIDVSIQLQEFSGHYSEVWLEFTEIEKFLIELHELNDSRNGNASIVSMSPDEFFLEIRASDNLGHMEIKTILQHYQYSGEKQRSVKVSGGFHVDPVAISQLISGIKSLIN